MIVEKRPWKNSESQKKRLFYTNEVMQWTVKGKPNAEMQSFCI